MNANEILDMIKAEDPAGFAKVNDKIALKIVRSTLTQIAKQLAESGDGDVTVAGLGSFKVKQQEKDKDGAKVVVRKILFKAAKQVDAAKKQERKAKKAAAKAE